MSVPAVPAVLADREGNRYARLAILQLGYQDHEVFEMACSAVDSPAACAELGEHHHWVPLAPVAIGGRN